MFFTKRKPAPVAARVPEAAKIVYPKLRNGSELVLSGSDGTPMARVKLVSFSPRELVMGRVEGALSLPVLNPGASVIVQGVGDGGKWFALACRVTDSSRVGLRAADLELMTGMEQRNDPRYYVGRPAEISEPGIPVNKNTGGEPCALADISMTGARIRTYEKYDMDQVVRLRVELYDAAGKISFTAQVVRVCPLEGGGYEYGLLFEALPPQKQRYLRDDLRHLAEAEGA